MKRILVAIVLAIALVSSVTVPAFAEGTKVTVDLGDLDSIARDAVLKAQKQAEEAKAKAENTAGELLKPENVEKLAGIGTSVATAIKETCKVLNVEVNEFVKTPVGLGVAAMVAYKVFGPGLLLEVKQIVGCLFALCVVGWSFRRFHMAKKVKHITYFENGKKKETKEEIVKPKWENSEAKGFSATAHFAIMVILLIIIIA